MKVFLMGLLWAGNALLVSGFYVKFAEEEELAVLHQKRNTDKLITLLHPLEQLWRAQMLKHITDTYVDTRAYPSDHIVYRKRASKSRGGSSRSASTGTAFNNGGGYPEVRENVPEYGNTFPVLEQLDQACQMVCSLCKSVLSIRWAALCRPQCLGKLEAGQAPGTHPLISAYDACLAVWGNKSDIIVNA